MRGQGVEMEQQAGGPLGADVAVTHILVADDPARSRDFWVNVLGAAVLTSWPGCRVLALGGPGGARSFGP